MDLPEGFIELVKAAAAERPAKPKNTGEIWDKFICVALMGGKRSDPEIGFLIKMLKDFLAMDYLLKTDGEDWRENVEKLLSERTARIKDEGILAMLKEFGKEIFRISASLKGAARFFQKAGITPGKLEELLATEEKTGEFIEELVKNEDVPNIRYTKIILWLHSLGYGDDFCAPSYQTKSFVNDVFGYYQFYEDDKYFMEKAREIAEAVKKKTRGVTVRDTSAAIFYYVTLRSMLPPRTVQKKNFTPKKLLVFMKKKKMKFSSISESLSGFDSREKIAEDLYDFLGNA